MNENNIRVYNTRQPLGPIIQEALADETVQLICRELNAKVRAVKCCENCKKTPNDCTRGLTCNQRYLGDMKETTDESE